MVGVAVQKKDHAHRLDGLRVDGGTEGAHDGHAAGGADLEVDDGDIGGVLDRGLDGQVGVGHPVNDGAGVRERGPDIVLDPDGVGDDQHFDTRICHVPTIAGRCRGPVRSTYHPAPVRHLLVPVFALLLLLPLAVMGQSDDGRRVDVIDISGPLDNQAVTFVSDTIRRSAEQGAEVVILQLDSPGVVAGEGEWRGLTELVGMPPVPVVAWIGPAPAIAYGGALSLATSAQITLAAPGVEIGYASPTFIAGDDVADLPGFENAVATVGDPIEGVVDDLVPAIQQVVGALDGAEVQVGDEVRLLALSEETEVVFHKPGYWARFLRLAVTPEAAFMFLVAGLTVAAFEFYAIGPGIAAAVAALSLFLATYGIAALPLRWWALVLVLLGWWLMTDSYQRGSVAVLTAVGSVLMLVGGLFYVDGAPQLQMNPLVTLVIVLVVVFFYTIAMPTVARSRFSTRTIGRDHLIGSRGVALVDFDPDGEVDVAGARWRASAHREAGIHQGDVVRISEVDGLVLEVEPVASEPVE